MNDPKRVRIEVPPPAEAAERWAGILQAWGYAWAGTILGKSDSVLARSMPELTACLHALIELGRRHAGELHEIYLATRRQPGPFGATAPAYSFAVRDLTGEERDRVRECITWCQRDREEHEPEDYAEARIAEARRRWPDVADLIGFAL